MTKTSRKPHAETEKDPRFNVYLDFHVARPGFHGMFSSRRVSCDYFFTGISLPICGSSITLLALI